MKYIKLFEAKVMSQSERDNFNLGKRLEYNLRKFFNDTEKVKNILVSQNFNANNMPLNWTDRETSTDKETYSFSFIIRLPKSEKLDLFNKEIKRLNVHKGMYDNEYEITIPQAEQLIKSLKTNFAEILIYLQKEKDIYKEINRIFKNIDEGALVSLLSMTKQPIVIEFGPDIPDKLREELYKFVGVKPTQINTLPVISLSLDEAEKLIDDEESLYTIKYAVKYNL